MNEIASETLLELAQYIAPESEVKIADDAEDRLTLEIVGDESGILIGRHGETLDALQYLTNLIVQRKQEGKSRPISVDTLGYREKRKEHMFEFAKETSDEVKQSGQPVRLEGLSPADRRHIHIALREEDGVFTESKGEGRMRVLIVSPSE